MKNKQTAILYGNCHMASVKICLDHSSIFSSLYEIKNIPLFYETGETASRAMLDACDLFIYQNIRENNQFGEEFSSSRLIELLSPECKQICVPNLYELGYGFFPQSLVRRGTNKYSNPQNPPYKGDERGLFVHGDLFIIQCMEKGLSLNETIEKAMSKEAMDKEKILDNFEYYKNKILDREKEWDVKIYNYIFSNYKHTQMFNDFGHPSSEVMKKISEGILLFLGLPNDLQDFKMYFELEEYEDPIYPCVKDCLKLKYSKRNIRVQSNKKIREDMDFIEYIKEYYYWCQ